MSIKKVVKPVLSIMIGMFGFYITSVFAADDIAGIAKTLTTTFKSVGELMTATAFIAGIGLVIASLFKFKQHKDNPQQVQMGTPITMLLIGVALIFLPNIIAPAGNSIFGSGATTGGFSGEGIKVIPGAGG